MDQPHRCACQTSPPEMKKKTPLFYEGMVIYVNKLPLFSFCGLFLFLVCRPNWMSGWNKEKEVIRREFVETVTSPRGAVPNSRPDPSPVIPTVLHSSSNCCCRTSLTWHRQWQLTPRPVDPPSFRQRAPDMSALVWSHEVSDFTTSTAARGFFFSVLVCILGLWRRARNAVNTPQTAPVIISINELKYMFICLCTKSQWINYKNQRSHGITQTAWLHLWLHFCVSSSQKSDYLHKHTFN